MDRGQIYLDILVTVALLAILSHALFSLVFSSYELISFTRARVTAKHLAQEKIELIRNLPYNNVGTQGGIPSGPLPQNESVSINGLKYQVKTDIVYIDDPFDGLAPTDTLPIDYKRVRVDVSWGGMASSNYNPINLITDISPKKIEQTAGGGTLSILVFDSQSKPVSGASVTIIGNGLNPPVNLNLKTADNGRIILPGAPVCISCYRITVEKNGYSSDRTYSTQEIANPNKPDISIIQSRVSQISFAIDKIATLTLFSNTPNQNFLLRGEKTLGTDTNDEPILKFDKNFSTDSGGQLTVSNVEWDNYHLSLPTGASYDIAGTNPLQPFIILADQIYTVKVDLTPHSNNSLLAIFKDSSQNPLASVSAKISSDGFEASGSSGTQGTANFGQIFFQNLEAKTYYFVATASGFLDFFENIQVSGYQEEIIILNAK